MSDVYLPEIHATGLLAACRRFGLPVPPEADSEHPATHWLGQPPIQPDNLESTFSCLTSTAPANADNTRVFSLPEQLESWGVARLEEHYDEDLIQRPVDPAPWTLSRQQTESAHQHLQTLFADLRLTLGDRDWLIFWGKSTNQTWLLGVFPWGWDWPQGPWIELPDLALPALISPLSLHLIQQAARDWLASLPAKNPAETNRPETTESLGYDWLESLAGKLILPTPRWRERLGRAPGDSNPQALPAFKGLPGLKKRLRRLSQSIWETFIVPHQRFTGHLQQGQEIYRLFLPTYLELGIWIRALAEPFEASGILAEQLAGHLNPSTRLRNELIQLWDRTQDLVRGDDALEPKLNVLLADPEFRPLWQLFMGHFGHHGPGSIDLACPRLADLPDQTFQILLQDWSQDADEPSRKPLNWLDRPRWQLLSWLINTRENWLMETLWALHQLRQRLETLAQEAVKKQLLSQPDDLWWCGPAEFTALDRGEAISSEQLLHRKDLYAGWQKGWRPDTQIQTGSVKGTGLKNGLTQGHLWLTDQATNQLPEGYLADQTLLVTHRVDPGWIPCLELVNGVILTQGDVYDSSAILLRELGKPAIVGLPEAATLKAGLQARLNADTGTLTVVTD